VLVSVRPDVVGGELVFDGVGVADDGRDHPGPVREDGWVDVVNLVVMRRGWGTDV